MTRRELVNGVLPTRLVCPWWARGVDSSCQEKGGSGLGAFEKQSREENTEQGAAMLKDGSMKKEALVELQPFMNVEPRKKPVVLKPRHG